MKKSVTTRFRVTKNGKGVQRKTALCHFRAKKTGTQLMRKGRPLAVPASVVRRIVSKQGEL